MPLSLLSRYGRRRASACHGLNARNFYTSSSWLLQRQHATKHNHSVLPQTSFWVRGLASAASVRLSSWRDRHACLEVLEPHGQECAFFRAFWSSFGF